MHRLPSAIRMALLSSRRACRPGRRLSHRAPAVLVWGTVSRGL